MDENHHIPTTSSFWTKAIWFLIWKTSRNPLIKSNTWKEKKKMDENHHIPTASSCWTKAIWFLIWKTSRNPLKKIEVRNRKNKRKRGEDWGRERRRKRNFDWLGNLVWILKLQLIWVFGFWMGMGLRIRLLKIQALGSL